MLTEDMVVEGPLVVVGNFRIGLVGEQTTCQLQQVVGAAVLSVVAGEVISVCSGFEEVLFVRHLTCDEGMIVDQCVEQ